ncbi:hypothetical protein [Comamonas testosteroni]|uniref:hypothetical protein n=1 Tax=Comamonas testosteroni TaxID=285 RepID=UPI0018AFBF6E|nr:hypothetical protein [Comamonas testosteroni]
MQDKTSIEKSYTIDAGKLPAISANFTPATILELQGLDGKSRIRVHSSGKVELINCSDADEAARIFWSAVERMGLKLTAPEAAPAAVAVPDERAAFEAWAKYEDMSVGSDCDGYIHANTAAASQAWQARAALAATPAAMERTCGVCGADEAFTGTCGGGRVNPTALCFEGAVATAIPAAASPVVLPEPVGEAINVFKDREIVEAEWFGKPPTLGTKLYTEQQLRALLATAPLQQVEGPTKDQATWCSYIAGMIGCYLKEPDDSPRIKAIDGIIARRLWALPSAAAATGLPAQAVPAFCHVASLKLKSLQERGYQITGYALEKPVEGAQPERGFINHGGFVGWWWDGQSLQAQADARDAEITWPKARDIGRIGDMSQVAHIRVGFDSDNDVFVSVWDENGGGSIEFCNPGGGGGGQSSRTRTALIALMVAMEADNDEKPSRDWWAQRAAIAAAKGERWIATS